MNLAEMSTKEQAVFYEKLAQEVANGTTPASVLDERFPPEQRDVMKKRVDFLRRSPLERALAMKKIEKMFDGLMQGGFNKTKGCRRFRPGKAESTTKKQMKRWRQVVKKLANLGMTPMAVEVWMEERIHHLSSRVS